MSRKRCDDSVGGKGIPIVLLVFKIEGRRREEEKGWDGVVLHSRWIL